jgi:4-amino-4-deoxy-L-arabinose transferase-like glycosyltransferase
MSYLSILLITGGCTLVAIGLWLGLICWDKISGVSTRQLFIIILAVGLLCRVSYSFLTPTFYAPDEQPHFKYVKYLAENRSLPVQTSQTGSPTNDWEYYQPPLYYLSLTPFYWLSQALFQEDAATVRLLRAFSIMLWGITVLFTIRFCESLNVYDVFIKIFVVSMISLLPTYTFLSSVINNDNLLITIGSGILCLVIQPKASLKNSALIGILLGLGLLTKLTVVVYIPLIVFILLIGLVRRTISWSTIPHIILSIVIAALIWAPWAWRNWNVYGSITAEELANVLYQWKSVFHAVLATLKYVQRSFWAVSGIYNNIDVFYPIIGQIVFYLAMIGLLHGLLSKREKLSFLALKNINILIASALAILINLMLVFRFGILYAQGQGRFLFPLLIPFSLLMAIGLRMFSVSDSEKSHIHITGFFITYAMSFTSFSLAIFTRA